MEIKQISSKLKYGIIATQTNCKLFWILIFLHINFTIQPNECSCADPRTLSGAAGKS